MSCLRAPTWTSQKFSSPDLETFTLASLLPRHSFCVCVGSFPRVTSRLHSRAPSTSLLLVGGPYLGTMLAETIRGSALHSERTLRSHTSPTYCSPGRCWCPASLDPPPLPPEAQPFRLLFRFHPPRVPLAEIDLLACSTQRRRSDSRLGCCSLVPSLVVSRFFTFTGNIDADDAGVCKVHLEDRMVRLIGPHSIIGRSIIVTAGEDDLGRVSFAFSCRCSCCWWVYLAPCPVLTFRTQTSRLVGSACSRVPTVEYRARRGPVGL